MVSEVMKNFFALTHPSGGVWLVGAFNQEKALVGAFSVITNLRMELIEALMFTNVLYQITAASVAKH